MRTAEIVSVGGIAIDVVVQSPQLPAIGQCVMADAVHHGLGGKAANQAVAAARLGGTVALIGAVGRDAGGDRALAALSAEGVAIEGVHRSAEVPTATVVLHLDIEGRKQAAVLPGANARVTRDLIDGVAGIIAAARVVVVQLEIPVDAVRHTIEIARRAGAQVILDPSPVRTMSLTTPQLLRDVTAVKPNAAEARALTGIDVHDVESARAAAMRLLEMGVQLVAIEAGRAGNLFVLADEEVFVPLYDVPSVDRTGAGDALVGALAVAMVESWPLRRTAYVATAAAALTTRSLGAQPSMPSRDDVYDLMQVSETSV
jgi:ribokinase